ncbi:MAG: hypothetical protein DRN04_12805, partial [Thermoprotei archaeon]
IRVYLQRDAAVQDESRGGLEPQVEVDVPEVYLVPPGLLFEELAYVKRDAALPHAGRPLELDYPRVVPLDVGEKIQEELLDDPYLPLPVREPVGDVAGGQPISVYKDRHQLRPNFTRKLQFP